MIDKDARTGPAFDAIWGAIKGWDIRTPRSAGYCSATGSHVSAILDALRAANIAMVQIRDDPAPVTQAPAAGPDDGKAQGGAPAEPSDAYRIRSAMRRLEAMLDLLEETAMHLAMAQGRAPPFDDGLIRPLGAEYPRDYGDLTPNLWPRRAGR